MNILLLTQFFSTTKGGGEYVFSLMAKSLAEKGNKVWVITNRIKNESYQTDNNIRFVFVPPTLEYKGGLPPNFSDNLRYVFSAIRQGKKIINEEKIDIIHSNNFSPAVVGSVLSWLTSKPHITTVHDIFSLCGKNYWNMWGKQNGVSKFNVMLAPFFEKMMTRLKHDAVHTVSEASRDDLIKFRERKPIYVIHNSIETEIVKKLEPIPFQFIFIGRLVFYKNLEVVLKAINIVKKDFPIISLIIIGGGPHRSSLEKMVMELGLQDNVKFMGYVSNEEKLRILSASQALVFPSLCEGFGLVILEAFSQEKPVLVSDVRPLSDIVSNGITGFVISPHDEIKWAKTITDVIINPENALKIGRKGKQVLEEKYNMQKMLENVLRMYKDLRN